MSTSDVDLLRDNYHPKSIDLSDSFNTNFSSFFAPYLRPDESHAHQTQMTTDYITPIPSPSSYLAASPAIAQPSFSNITTPKRASTTLALTSYTQAQQHSLKGTAIETTPERRKLIVDPRLKSENIESTLSICTHPPIPISLQPQMIVQLRNSLGLKGNPDIPDSKWDSSSLHSTVVNVDVNNTHRAKNVIIHRITMTSSPSSHVTTTLDYNSLALCFGKIELIDSPSVADILFPIKLETNSEFSFSFFVVSNPGAHTNPIVTSPARQPPQPATTSSASHHSPLVILPPPAKGNIHHRRPGTALSSTMMTNPMKHQTPNNPPPKTVATTVQKGVETVHELRLDSSYLRLPRSSSKRTFPSKEDDSSLDQQWNRTRANRSPIIPSFSHTKARSLASSPRVSNRSLNFSQTSSPIASSFLAHSSSNLAAPKPRQPPTNHDEIPLFAPRYISTGESRDINNSPSLTSLISHVNKSDQVPLSLPDANIALRNISLVVEVKWSFEGDEEERVISTEVSAPEPPVLNEQPPKAAEDDEEGNLYVKKRKVTILTQPLSTFKEEPVPDTPPEPLPDEEKKEEKAHVKLVRQPIIHTTHSKPTVRIYSLPSFTLTFSVPPKVKKAIPFPVELTVTSHTTVTIKSNLSLIILPPESTSTVLLLSQCEMLDISIVDDRDSDDEDDSTITIPALPNTPTILAQLQHDEAEKKRDIQQFVWERAGKVKLPFRGATPMTPIIGKVGQSSGAYESGGRWMVDLKKDVDAYEAEEREEEERRAQERKQLLARRSFDFDMKRQELREEKRRKRREEEQEALMKQAKEMETLSETPSSSQLAADAKRSTDPLPAHQKVPSNSSMAAPKQTNNPLFGALYSGKTKSSPTKDRTEPSDTAQQALLETRTEGSEPQEVPEPLITQHAITPTLSPLGSTSVVAASTPTTFDNEDAETESESESTSSSTSKRDEAEPPQTLPSESKGLCSGVVPSTVADADVLTVSKSRVKDLTDAFSLTELPSTETNHPIVSLERIVHIDSLPPFQSTKTTIHFIATAAGSFELCQFALYDRKNKSLYRQTLIYPLLVDCEE
ncbi:hypothetical protein BLNAU_2145 [Blattamonas nauphoetae]|uniref:Uncharacterized protein n=1 Tax=Blattamonas nauphoetae TaxID=2049346 RepID=A0ABQ9YG20_9EUKA|nr:hypothetical protein BLNAU_2145 [Blattamonas nauphoetae]